MSASGRTLTSNFDENSLSYRCSNVPGNSLSRVCRGWLFPIVVQGIPRMCHPRCHPAATANCYPRSDPVPSRRTAARVTKLAKLATPLFAPFARHRHAGTEAPGQAFGSFCLALPQPASSFDPARSISSSVSRIEKASPPLIFSSSSQLTGAATGAPSRARAE
jgi:hypothetical protein